MDSYISTSFVRSPRLSDLLPHPGDVGSYIIRLGPIPHRLAAISPLPRSPGTPAAFFCSVSAGTESGDKCGVGSVDHGRPPQLAVSVVATTGRRLTSAWPDAPAQNPRRRRRSGLTMPSAKTTAATQAAMPTCNAGWPSICRKEMRKPKQRGSEPVLDHDGGF